MTLWGIVLWNALFLRTLRKASGLDTWDLALWLVFKKRFSLDGNGGLQHFLQWVQRKYEYIFVNWDKVPKNSHLYDYINMNENQFFFQEQLSRSYLGQFSKVQPVQARYLVGCVLPTKILPICPTELNPWKDSLWDYIKKFSTRSST